jgi:ankyrin repeat protein
MKLRNNLGFVSARIWDISTELNIFKRIGKTGMTTPLKGKEVFRLSERDVVAVQELIEKGVDPNAQTKLGISPLRMAAKKQETEITHLLIAKGADVNAGDQNGKTPLMEAASAGRPANAEVLLSAGAKVNAIDENGFTALMWATMLGFPEIAEILLESGAEVNTRSKDARTAMGICQKLVENTTKSLARAFKSNSEVSELQIRLANHTQIFQIPKEAGGRE